MSDDRKKLSVIHTFSLRQLDRPGLPSANMAEEEARLIAELARQAHRKGRRFEGWPQVRLTGIRPADTWTVDLNEIRAEVWTVPA